MQFGLTMVAALATLLLVTVSGCSVSSGQVSGTADATRRDREYMNAEAADSAPALVTMLVPPQCGEACARLEAWLATKELPVQRVVADPQRCGRVGWQRTCKLVLTRGEPRIWLGHLAMARADDAGLAALLRVFERWPRPASMLRPVAPDAPIMMYTAPWCKPCEAAKKWFAQRGLPLGQKDVARNLLWRMELGELLCSRFEVCEGMSLPVFVSGDRVMRGFDAARMKTFLAGTPDAQPSGK